MKNFTKKLDSGTHILSLPLDKAYNIEALFSSDLTGSSIEKLDYNGRFIDKEKVFFENNEFVVSDKYKILKPFETLRLTLKRPIVINWDIAFKSNSFIKKEDIKVTSDYDKQKALLLMQLSSLVYDKEKDIKERILNQYAFDDFFYFSKQSHKNFLKKGFFKLFYTFFRSKTNIVDLQFMKLSKFDESIGKEIIVLVFQGSQEPEDWMTNMSIKRINYYGKNEVHKGFYDSLQLFLRTVKNRKFNTKDNKGYILNKDVDFLNDNCKIILTGHSLGGAVATLVGCYLHDIGIQRENMSIYTFGAPPIGTEDFCREYRKKLELYRVINENDVIPKIEKITILRHLGEEVILESNENEVHSCADYIDNLIDDLNRD